MQLHLSSSDTLSARNKKIKNILFMKILQIDSLKMSGKWVYKDVKIMHYKLF